MTPRPPIVTILGHVDHGKTTLLDHIRKSRLAAKEYGGITQRIGAYEVKTNIKGYKTNTITFIDTPGHEAFSQLRARGAQIADIAILLIDAKDSVMPQTAESISHIKASGIPFIVVMNKMDLPDADPNKVKTDLMKYEVLVEDKGGTVPVVSVSAKTGKGIPELLETILLVSSDLNLTYEPNHEPKAYVIETKKDRRGVVASVIIKDGTLTIGDVVFARDKKAKIKSMLNDQGVQIKQVYPSTPFELLGFEEMPEVGMSITKTQAEKKESQAINLEPKRIDEASFLLPKTEQKKLSLIIKADSQGTLDAVYNSLIKNENIKIVLSTVGDIHKSDIFLAKTTKSIVIGFSTNIAPDVANLAKQEKIIIKTYQIIYELLDELREVAQLLKEKETKERNLKGEAKILANFIIEKEKIYGVKVTKGKINLSDELEVYRQNKPIGKTRLVSLKIRAKTVSEIKKDQEAGMLFDSQLDFRIGDVVKSIL